MQPSLKFNRAQARRLERNLRKLNGNSKHLKKYFGRAGAYMVQSAVENFAKQKAPDGARWKKLKPATIKARERAGKDTRRILQVEGDLKNSVGVIKTWKRGVRVGPSAGIFQGIGNTHQFGDTERNIPAREFMGHKRKDVTYLTNHLVHHVLDGVESG